MKSSTTEKDIGNLQPKTPLSILPRSWRSPPVTSFVPNAQDLFNPVGSKSYEMSRKSRLSSTGSKPTLGGPSISSTMAMDPSSAETPDMSLIRQTGTEMPIPSSELPSTHSDGNVIYQNNSVKSFTKRKSYAQITRFGLAAPKASAHVDPPKMSPTGYFDAKKIVESSPVTSLSFTGSQSGTRSLPPEDHHALTRSRSSRKSITPQYSDNTEKHLRLGKDTSSSPTPSPKAQKGEQGEYLWEHTRAPTPRRSAKDFNTDAHRESDHSSRPSKDFVLVEHLRNQFGQPAYSDLQILVGAQDSRHLQELYQNGDWEVFYTHMAVLDASPFMHQLLEARCYSHDDGLNYIHAVFGSSFNHVQAFSMALQYLYSMPLVKDESLRDKVLASTPDIPSDAASVQPYLPERSMARFALCYAASGLFLDIPKIVEKGMELANGLLAWSTVEVLLQFGMRASTFLITCPEVHNWSIADEALRGHDTQHSWPRKVSLAHIKAFEDRWATATLNVALEFIANGITAEFVVYDRAQAEVVSPRISYPLWTLPHSQCSDPTLDRFRFGGMPSFVDTAPTSKAVLVASAMFLTLPFEVLTKLLDILKQRGAARVGLIMEVVRLREERRVRAVHRYHSQVWPPGTLRGLDLEVLAYREMVTIDDRKLGPDVTILEPSVLRQWVGLKHPQMEALKRAREEKGY